MMTSFSTKVLTTKQVAALLVSLLVAALCGIVYELIISTVSSYLLGNSVYQFSLTIGLFMFSMGLGSIVTKYLSTEYIENFIFVEIMLAIIGGATGLILFLVFPYAREYYEFVSISLIVVIGALVGMEIPLLTTALAEFRSTRHSIADVMSFDYSGALIGSLLFPLILLPKLGLIETSFIIGFLNLVVATLTASVFWDHLNHKKTTKFLLFSAALLLSLGVYFGSDLTKYAEKHLYFDQIVFQEQTPYQKLVFTRSVVNTDHRLYIDGHIQFSSKDEYRYHEYLVHPVMAMPGARNRVLILGGGDGLALREVLKYSDVEEVVLVDIDPAMIEFGKNFPTMISLNQSAYKDDRVSTVAKDAFVYLNQPLKKFNRVIIDMPDPHNEAINKLYSTQFYELVRRAMERDGYVSTQSSSPFYVRTAYWIVAKTLDERFKNVVSYHFSLPSFGVWGFHLASAESIDIGDINIDVPTRSITDASLKAALVFSKDTEKPAEELVANSIMQPNLYIVYSKEISN